MPAAVQEALASLSDGALWVAGAVLAAVVSIYAFKHVAKAITMPRY